MLDSPPRTAISRGRPCERGSVCQKLGRKGPQGGWRPDTQPGAQAVPSVRNTSASSRQSPSVRAEATSFISLSAVLARPRASLRSRCFWIGWGRPGWPERSVPALATRRWSFKETRMQSGDCVVASIGCSFSGVGFVFQNHYPRLRGAPLRPFWRPHIPPVRWIRS